MFGRNKQPIQDPVDESPEVTDDRPGAQAPKGRPTPSRREAEARRREQRKIPSDPKAAKKAQKDRARKERSLARERMLAGDERYLPARDQGPVRAFVRDYVDQRWRLSEFFVFVAVGILVAGFIQNAEIQGTVSMLWFIITGLVALEMTWMLIRLSRELKERWPDKADRKGALFYGSMRALQVRKLRIPPPRFKVGHKPD